MNRKIDFRKTFNFYKVEIIVFFSITLFFLFLGLKNVLINPEIDNYSCLLGLILGLLAVLFPFVIDFWSDKPKFWFIKTE